MEPFSLYLMHCPFLTFSILPGIFELFIVLTFRDDLLTIVLFHFTHLLPFKGVLYLFVRFLEPSSIFDLLLLIFHDF